MCNIRIIYICKLYYLVLQCALSNQLNMAWNSSADLLAYVYANGFRSNNVYDMYDSSSVYSMLT